VIYTSQGGKNNNDSKYSNKSKSIHDSIDSKEDGRY